MQLLSAMSDWTVWQYIASLIDILVMAFVIYKGIFLIRGTRAVQLVRGFVVVLLIFLLADLLQLRTLSWILNQFWTVIVLAMAIIFQPELRRMLERLGRSGKILGHSAPLSGTDLTHMIEEVVGAAVHCSKLQIGALIAIEGDTGLSDVIENGVSLDAEVSRQLLGNIFVTNTPLHDGAAIISNGRIAAAACFLPLTDNPYISLSLGTRHRAAIGLSEVSDALVVVVSEETGAISVAQEGKLFRNLDEKQLRIQLSTGLVKTEKADTSSRSSKQRSNKRRKGAQADD